MKMRRILKSSKRLLRPALGVMLVAVVMAASVFAVQGWQYRTAVKTLAGEIDDQLLLAMTAKDLKPAPMSSDETFIRRVYLDLTGTLPLADDVRRFVADDDGGKRRSLIARVIRSEAFAISMADRWEQVLFREGGVNHQIDIRPLDVWLEEQFASNRRWDEVAFDLVTATGRQDAVGAATPFLAAREPHEITATMARSLLGVRLDCAQCHDHPYTAFTHEDFWSFAAFFEKVDTVSDHEATPNNEFLRTRLDVGHDITVVELMESPERELPDRALTVQPQFLGGEPVNIPDDADRRPVLGAWLASDRNPYFARAMVNRIWDQFFGRGMVHPVDDLRTESNASNPALMAMLAERFVDSEYNVRLLVEAVCNTDAYQRSSNLPESERPYEDLLPAMPVKVMTPRQTFDSLVTVLGPEAIYRLRYESAIQSRWEARAVRDSFCGELKSDSEPDHRAFQRGIPQVLLLMNGENVQRGIREHITVLRKRGVAGDAMIDELYLSVLSRLPSADERAIMHEFMATFQPTEQDQAYAGVLWALLNSSEFLLVS